MMIKFISLRPCQKFLSCCRVTISFLTRDPLNLTGIFGKFPRDPAPNLKPGFLKMANSIKTFIQCNFPTPFKYATCISCIPPLTLKVFMIQNSHVSLHNGFVSKHRQAFTAHPPHDFLFMFEWPLLYNFYEWMTTWRVKERSCSANSKTFSHSLSSSAGLEVGCTGSHFTRINST